MKQYAVYCMGQPIEHTGYFKTVQAVRNYLKKRYGTKFELTFRAVYPNVENEFYSI